MSEPGQATDEAGDGRTFEDLMSELEAVTERLAAGDLGIEAAADLYERAQRLHTLATARLAQVQARVDALATPGPADRPPGQPGRAE
jgi:exodeoxyribonuclease VII small subunit